MYLVKRARIDLSVRRNWMRSSVLIVMAETFAQEPL